MEAEGWTPLHASSLRGYVWRPHLLALPVVPPPPFEFPGPPFGGSKLLASGQLQGANGWMLSLGGFQF